MCLLSAIHLMERVLHLELALKYLAGLAPEGPEVTPIGEEASASLRSAEGYADFCRLVSDSKFWRDLRRGVLIMQPISDAIFDSQVR